jgi:ferredoxin
MGGCGMGRGKGRGGGGLGLGMPGPSRGGFMGFGAMYGAAESLHVNQRPQAPADEPSGRRPRQGREAGARASASVSGRKAAALVRPERCAGCGICIDVCPVGAIRMEQRAVVDPVSCTACAACVTECPNEAVIIVQQRI